MKNKINPLLILKSIGVIFLYYSYFYIFIFILRTIGLNLSNLSVTNKTILFFIIDITLIIILWLIYKNDLKKEFSIFKGNWKHIISENFKYWVFGLALMSILNILITTITSSDIANNEEAVRGMIRTFPIYAMFSVCIVAPIVEEIVFRKTLWDIIKNKTILIIISGLLFGLVHVIGSYETYIDLLYILPYGVFGSIFAYMYHKTKTVFTSMSMHFIHNSLLLIIYIISYFVIGG